MSSSAQSIISKMNSCLPSRKVSQIFMSETGKEFLTRATATTVTIMAENAAQKCSLPYQILPTYPNLASLAFLQSTRPNETTKSYWSKREVVKIARCLKSSRRQSKCRKWFDNRPKISLRRSVRNKIREMWVWSRAALNSLRDNKRTPMILKEDRKIVSRLWSIEQGSLSVNEKVGR